MAISQKELEKYARQYTNFDGFNKVMTYCIYRTIQPYLRGGSILEAGCGEGGLTHYLYTSNIWDEYKAIDGSKTMLDKLRKTAMAKDGPGYRHHFLDIEQVYIEKYKPRKAEFENIICSQVLEHVPNPKPCIKNLVKLLAWNGMLFITVPNCTSVHREAAMAGGLIDSLEAFSDDDKRVGHKQHYNILTLMQDIRECGFGHMLADVGGIMYKPLPQDAMDRLTNETLEAYYWTGKLNPKQCSVAYVVLRKDAVGAITDDCRKESKS